MEIRIHKWTIIYNDNIINIMTTYKIKVLETGEIQEWDLQSILNEINRDHSDKWTGYDESDWLEGWNEWVEGEFYSLVKD